MIMEEFNKTNILRLLSETGSIIDKYEAIARETGTNCVPKTAHILCYNEIIK